MHAMTQVRADIWPAPQELMLADENEMRTLLGLTLCKQDMYIVPFPAAVSA
jgi:hypothetical protein